MTMGTIQLIAVCVFVHTQQNQPPESCLASGAFLSPLSSFPSSQDIHCTCPRILKSDISHVTPRGGASDNDVNLHHRTLRSNLIEECPTCLPQRPT